ncbi:thiolase domain-containing protein [Desulfofundulus sp. TPOSR]|uniref:thiolase domain-containing protein n=1 Tax=Desulfofundulus sp. TPOSR TaxID=2714340 RepID=UPI00140D4444|nr:thiolase domain-containing protein [Desulfofundulus sp. TPOSR]NHM28768.1 thiolase domain-containing protein [Desulfofundulus sp. TPOSR]
MREVAVIGAGMSRFGDRMDKGAAELLLEAFDEAVRSVDKGMEIKDIQMAFFGNQGVGGSQLALLAAQMVEAIGLCGIPAFRVENACSSSSFAFINAVQAVASGVCDVALAGGVEKMREISGKQVRQWMGVAGDNEWERQVGITFPGAYALAAQRHMLDFGTSREQLSMVAVKNHECGFYNPKAQLRMKITLEKALKSPIVAYPLNIFDCCPTSDGASAVIICAKEIASKYTDKAVTVLGYGAASDTISITNRKTITALKATIRAAQMAYRMAGIGPQEISFAEVHDCFTIAEIMAYEDLGFCPKGEGGKYVEAGHSRLGGMRPVNASGGLKSKGHPLGATGTAQIVEVFKQIRGEAEPERQVENNKVGLTHNAGGFGGTATVCIFGMR